MINGGGGAAYYIGVYDPQTLKLNASGPLQRVEYGLANWFVAGTAEDKRILHIGFIEPYPFNASYPRSFKHTCYDPGYFCPQSAAREISYDDVNGRLVSNPIREYKALRNGTLVSKSNVVLQPGAPSLQLKLPQGTGAEMDVEMEVALGKEAFIIGIEVLAGKTSARATTLTLNISSPLSTGGRIGNVTLNAPRMAPAVTYTAPLVIRPDETSLHVRVLVDRSIVEAFVGDGRAVLTTRDYPTSVEDTGVRLWAARGSGAATLSKLDAWSMGCGWADE